MKPVYISHPLGGGAKRYRNALSAAKHVAWLAERFAIAPIADWIILGTLWPEERKKLGLAIDHVLVELVGTIVMCGPRISPGMVLEKSWASRVVDLTDINLLDDFDALERAVPLMAAQGIDLR